MLYQYHQVLILVILSLMERILQSVLLLTQLLSLAFYQIPLNRWQINLHEVFYCQTLNFFMSPKIKSFKVFLL